MANSRVVNSHFWDDNYIVNLDPIEKLVFLYFLTNPYTTIAGVYEINLRKAAFDTGIDFDMVKKILDRFCADGKMWYKDGWIILKNFVRHQRPNPSVLQGIRRVLDNLPEWLQEKVQFEQSNTQIALFTGVIKQTTTDSPQTGTPNLTLTKPNLNLTKPNATKSRGFDKSKTLNKKVYAKAVQADRQLQEKELSREGTGYEQAKSIAGLLKQRRGK